MSNIYKKLKDTRPSHINKRKTNRRTYDKEFKSKIMELIATYRASGLSWWETEKNIRRLYPEIRDFSTFRISYTNMNNADKIKVLIDENAVNNIAAAKTDLLITRKWNNQCNKNLHKLANDEARWQIINEAIENKQWNKFELPSVKKLKDPKGFKDTIYVIGDVHYRGEQDKELVKNLFEHIRNDIVNRNYQNVDLWFTGDNIDGEIHNNQLRDNDWTVDCACDIAEMYTDYINQLPNVRNVRFVFGNHEELRLWGDKGTKNNVGKFISKFMKRGLRKDIDFKFGEMLWFDYKGKNILLIHGHQPMCKNKNKIITTCTSEYRKQPDYVVMGHFHSAKANQFSKCDWLLVNPAVKNWKSDWDIEHGYTGFSQYMKLKLNSDDIQINCITFNED